MLSKDYQCNDLSTINLAIQKECKKEAESMNPVFASSILDYITALIIVLDTNGRVIYANHTLFVVTGYQACEILGKGIGDVLPSLEEIRKQIVTHRRQGPVAYESTTETRAGERMIISWSLSYIQDNQCIVCTGFDISERRMKEEKLQFYSMHDRITGLYNRAYFEEELQRLENSRNNPIGLIILDVDGLKLINDVMGHEAGDSMLIAAARILRESFREGDVVARIGGDEFAVLLPQTSVQILEEACARIQKGIECFNGIDSEWPLSISMGCAVRKHCDKSLSVVLKEADDNMYLAKLQQSCNYRNNIISRIKHSLKFKDFLDDESRERLTKLAVEVGQNLGLSIDRITNLKLLALFKNIGNVGLPNELLFKKGSLTPEENTKIQRHCEIGYRIARVDPTLTQIAELILKHHEWWDGKGYPLKLKGEEIPLECRIISILDAYDSMTRDRPYRIVLSHEEAIKEICRCAGTQFDPHIVQVVSDILRKTLLAR